MTTTASATRITRFYRSAVSSLCTARRRLRRKQLSGQFTQDPILPDNPVLPDGVAAYELGKRDFYKLKFAPPKQLLEHPPLLASWQRAQDDAYRLELNRASAIAHCEAVTSAAHDRIIEPGGRELARLVPNRT